MSDLGSIRGQIILDARQALIAFTQVRQGNIKTVTSLNRGAAVTRQAGKAMVGTGLALGAVFGLAVKKAADFEKKMDFFGAVSNASAKDMERASEKALQLGADTRYSANEIADSFVELGKAGVAANDIIDGIGEAVANLGAAADIPLTDAAGIIVSQVQTFGLAASDAVTVADQLAGAANSSMVEVQDMGVALKYAGGVAAAMGLQFDEVNSAIALLGKYGIRGSTAGTSLRQMLGGLSGNSKQAVAVMKELGIVTADGGNKFFDAKGKVKPLAEVIDILNDSTKNLTQEQKVKALKTMFNIRSLPSVLNLMKEGSKGLNEMSAAIDKTKAADVAAKRLDNLAGDIEILRGNIDTLLIKAGTPFQEFLRGIVQGITGLVQWFGNLSPSTQQTIMKFIAFTAAGLIVMGTILLIVGTVMRFVSMLFDLVAAFRFVGKIIGIVAKGFKLLSLSMLTNPVFLIIAAIVALALGFVYLWKHSERFRNFMKGLWEGIKSAWNATLEWIKGLPEWFAQLWESIKTKTSEVWNAITNFFTVTIPEKLRAAWEWIKQTAISAWEGIISFFAQLPGRIGSFVSMIVNGIVNFFAQLPYRLGFIIGLLAGLIVQGFIALGTWLWTTVSNIVTGVIGWFQQLPGRLAAIFTNIWTWAQQKWSQIKTTVVNLALQLVNGVVNFIQQLPGRVASFFQMVYTKASTWMQQTWSRTKQLAADTYNGIVNWIQKLPGRIGQFFSDMYQKASQKLSELKSKATEVATGIYNTIKEWVGKIPGAVSGAVTNAIQAFKDMVSSAFNAAKDFAKGLWDGFKKGLGINSPSLIEKQMVQITEVTDEETTRLRGQIRILKDASRQIAEVPFNYNQSVVVAQSGAKAIVDSLKGNQNQLRQLIDLSSKPKAPPMYSSVPKTNKEDLMLAAMTNLNSTMAQTRTSDERRPVRLVLGDGTEFDAYLESKVEDGLNEVATTVRGGRK